ncbi:MAG: hypothetical protein EOM91_03490 [Sphingobacteriia bacterium]|nr:hypothetical protein [Sphingobacteriia bacterium]NCC39213.1 hypothetical protein [Gammaproteobacteria bacterium]
MVSVLEERFPHVLQRLERCWGNPDHFEEVFYDLMIDKRGDRSGWPFDAWSELNFLQSIHDIAYGMSSARTAHQANLLEPLDLTLY